jgi:hypothetical protein
MDAAPQSAQENPFSPDAHEAYRRWRECKLDRFPRRVEDLVVEVRDPRALDAREVGEIAHRCAIANMAMYASPLAGVEDKGLARSLGERLGLDRLVPNPLADDDAITSLESDPGKAALGFIPYSRQRLLWHTDGYYNPPGDRIRAFILHCVRPAAAGGANRLLDPEIAYLLLRDADPRHVQALSLPDAMTIPASAGEGRELRPATTGPVFSVEGGALHMRYTSRTRSIEWRADGRTQEAARCLAGILESSSPYVFTLRLEGGQGLVCNNVLHDRSAFTDAAPPAAGRLVYRARYSDRIGAPARGARRAEVAGAA